MPRLVPAFTCVALALGALVTSGCAENVTGHWCGTKVEKDDECVGDEAGYLLLKQSGDKVTGQACEALDRDCYVIEDGTIDGSAVTFRYTFAEFEVAAKLEVAEDRMSGVLHSSKCDCDIGFNFHRID